MTHALSVSPDALRQLVRGGFLNSAEYERALVHIGVRPDAWDWGCFWGRIFLLAGVLFAIAGVGCFFAWNWAGMHYFQKFGLIIGLMLVCGALPLWRSFDSLLGSSGLLACGLLAGPLLVVYGQYAQTGVDAWELFRAWTLFFVPLALIGRQNGLLVAGWAAGSLWLALWVFQTYLASWETPFFAMISWQFLVCQLLVLVLWEAGIWQARLRQECFLKQCWSVRLVALCLLFALSWANAWGISVSLESGLTQIMADGWVAASIYVLLIGAGFYWYRRGRPDTLMLTAGLLSLNFLFFIWIFTFFDLFSAGGMLFAAILLAFCAFVSARLLMSWHRQTRAKTALCVEDRKNGSQSSIFLKACTVSALFRFLDKGDGSSAETFLEKKSGTPTPWSIRGMLTLCAWIAAGFLMVFIFFISSNVSDTLLLLFSGLFLMVSMILGRAPMLFFRQFALGLGIAGFFAMPFALMVNLDMRAWWELPILATALFCLVCIRQFAMRCLAFLAIILASLTLLHSVYDWGSLTLFGVADSGLAVAILCVWALITVLIFAALTLFMVWGWKTEGDWLQSTRQETFIRPALFALPVALLIMGGIWAAFGASAGFGKAGLTGGEYADFASILALQWAGIGISLGLLCMFFMRWKAISSREKLCIASGMLFLSASAWWLPWLPVAVLLLGLGRFLGSTSLIGCAVLFLTVCITVYYYALPIGLLYKASALTGTGLGMLMLGVLLYRAIGISETMSDKLCVDSRWRRLALVVLVAFFLAAFFWSVFQKEQPF